ncbi:ester cyclase [Lacinutrix neustonica]|uniref:Ester cyclase n=1 Tax=Lacinutrix neustonica TaxID=2980107 RepID=A0A9E8SEZ7_9FLAO|nr:ester cyclase [Lacinutrix neustonica]WAC02839.1 ester cyclase [Lacinutrix neustonica]
MKHLIYLFLALFVLASCQKDEDTLSKSENSEEHMNALDEDLLRNTIASIAASWNTNDPSLFNSHTSVDIIRNTNGKRAANNQKEYDRTNRQPFLDAFPNFNVAITDTHIVGNIVYTNWTVSGTNIGEYRGNPPTGKDIKLHGISVWTFNDDGKLMQEDAYFDRLSLFQQLGYQEVPPLTQ